MEAYHKTNLAKKRASNQIEQENEVSSSKKLSSKNFMWTAPMSKFLLNFLAEQAREGLKCDKGFKNTAMVAATQAVKETFKENVTETNVLNHIRNVKAKWAVIQKIKGLSGAGWDDKEKKIIMGQEEYVTYLKAHPASHKFINKPIEDYDLLAIVCGNDHATGQFGKQGTEALAVDLDKPAFDVPEISHGLDDHIEIMETSSTAPPQNEDPSSQAPSSSARKTRGKLGKKAREAEFQVMEDLVQKLGDIGEALHNANSIRFSQDLYREVMNMEGEHNKDVLGKAYDYLLANPTTARGFMAKDAYLRQAWMESWIVMSENI